MIHEVRRIAFFDLATKTGWASLNLFPDDVFASGPQLRSGVQDFSLAKNEKDIDRNFAARRFFTRMVKEMDLVYYERIEFQHQSMQAGRVYFGLETVLELVCLERGVKCLTVRPNDIKREATGKGNGKKDQMEKLARIQWPDQRIEDNNQSDALWGLRFACRKHGISMGLHVEELDLK